MITRRLLFGPIVLALLVGMLGGLVMGSAPALAAGPETILVIPIKGTVTSESESVALSGRAQIQSTPVVVDPTAPPVGVVLQVNLLAVTGKGLSTRAPYFANGEHVLIRPFAPGDTVEVTFPLMPVKPNSFLSAVSVLASFELTFDPVSGALTAATGTLE